MINEIRTTDDVFRSFRTVAGVELRSGAKVLVHEVIHDPRGARKFHVALCYRQVFSGAYYVLHWEESHGQVVGGRYNEVRFDDSQRYAVVEVRREFLRILNEYRKVATGRAA